MAMATEQILKVQVGSRVHLQFCCSEYEYLNKYVNIIMMHVTLLCYYTRTMLITYFGFIVVLMPLLN